MRYHNITKDDMLNGDGLRTVLWVAGCSHGCKNCHNPITWDICGGIPFDDAAREELFAELSQPYISGVTMSGGDPLHMANRDEIGALIKEIHETFPDKNIWIYTGYLWEEVKDLPFMPLADVLVDGPFIEEQKDTALHWKGSANQRVIEAIPGRRPCGPPRLIPPERSVRRSIPQRETLPQAGSFLIFQNPAKASPPSPKPGIPLPHPIVPEQRSRPSPG